MQWINAPILVSQKGTVFTVQRINVILKEVKKKYRLKVKNFSCHSLRKTFGRQVYNMNSDNSELALVKLMELFNHSSLAITKRYLGLRQEEILQAYDCLGFWTMIRRHFLRRNLFIDPVQILSPLNCYQRKCNLEYKLQSVSCIARTFWLLLCALIMNLNIRSNIYNKRKINLPQL